MCRMDAPVRAVHVVLTALPIGPAPVTLRTGGRGAIGPRADSRYEIGPASHTLGIRPGRFTCTASPSPASACKPSQRQACGRGRWVRGDRAWLRTLVAGRAPITTCGWSAAATRTPHRRSSNRSRGSCTLTSSNRNTCSAWPPRARGRSGAGSLNACPHGCISSWRACRFPRSWKGARSTCWHPTERSGGAQLSAAPSHAPPELGELILERSVILGQCTYSEGAVFFPPHRHAPTTVRADARSREARPPCRAV